MTTSSAPHLDGKGPGDAGPEIVEMEGAAVVFAEARPQLFLIVRRMLGSCCSSRSSHTSS